MVASAGTELLPFISGLEVFLAEAGLELLTFGDEALLDVSRLEVLVVSAGGILVLPLAVLGPAPSVVSTGEVIVLFLVVSGLEVLAVNIGEVFVLFLVVSGLEVLAVNIGEVFVLFLVVPGLEVLAVSIGEVFVLFLVVSGLAVLVVSIGAVPVLLLLMSGLEVLVVSTAEALAVVVCGLELLAAQAGMAVRNVEAFPFASRLNSLSTDCRLGPTCGKVGAWLAVVSASVRAVRHATAKQAEARDCSGLQTSLSTSPLVSV